MMTLVSILEKILFLFPRTFLRLLNYWYPKDQVNINLDLINQKQQKVLISYISLLGVDFSSPLHAACFQLNQIVHYFIQNGYCVDVCECNDLKAYERLKHKHYDIILGFGKVFKSFCSSSDIPMRILYITENNPEIVKIKYEERLKYIKERHPHLNFKKTESIIRNDYYDIEQYTMADFAILMSSSYNASTITPYFKKLWTINSNAILNGNYQFDKSLLYLSKSSKHRFLWFGSTGLIHKGVDLLLDAFSELPDYRLDCYGINRKEKKLFEALNAPNVFDLGYINVLDDQFIESVVMQYNFVIFPSCSEGMSTAVATCMAHGLIPILTKETGFESTPFMIELKDYKIQSIKQAVQFAASMDQDKVLHYREQCYEYARKSFSLGNFDESFRNIMNELLEI